MKRLRSAIISTFIALSFLALGDIPLYAQQQKVVLAFFENTSGDLRIVSEDGSEEKFGDELNFGDTIPVRWTLLTGNDDSAELLVEPNRTIIKVAENTNFQIEDLQSLDGASTNSFNLGFGKFRAIAGKVSGEEKYDFKGLSATCGVRGTDFGMQRQVIGAKEVEEAFVFNGEVSYTKHATGETIILTANRYADAQAPVFQPLDMPSEKASGLLQELRFKKLEAASVPQVGEAAAEALQKEEMAKEAEEAAKKAKKPSGWEFLSFDVGALTVGDNTYAKAVLTPSFSIAKLKVGLYLPLIYGTDVFDTGDWYKPKGNNEWSFGTDQEGEIGAVLRDIAVDLALKIEYVQWAEVNDPFYLRIGSIHNVTLGHGLVMRNYANDIDFPAIRRLGVNIKADFGNAGFETVVNDLTEPEIFGGRFYSRPAAPAFPMGIGISSTFDLDPAGELPSDVAESIGDPVLTTIGFDLDYPFVKSETSSFTVFADAAGMLPYFRHGGSGAFDGVSEGPSWDSLIAFGPFAFRNVGTAAGAFGYFGPVNWRLEWRLSKGAFTPAMIDRLYERTRGSFAVSAAEYAHDPTGSDLDKIVMGIYGEIGYTMEKVFSVEMGYLFPFSTSGGFHWEESDYLHIGAALFKGAIPGFPLGASISYDRYYFMPMLLWGETEDGRQLSVFDENAVFQASLIYGASDNVDIILLMTMTATRDEEGSIEYTDDLTPKMSTTFSIETHVHF
jgi:hypothetical protein